jgi:hypothetical protein
VYKYPVGLFGLQINIPFVRGVMSCSNFSIGGNENPSSILEGIVFTTAPATIAKLYNWRMMAQEL